MDHLEKKVSKELWVNPVHLGRPVYKVFVEKPAR